MLAITNCNEKLVLGRAGGREEWLRRREGEETGTGLSRGGKWAWKGFIGCGRPGKWSESDRVGVIEMPETTLCVFNSKRFMDYSLMQDTNANVIKRRTAYEY